MFAVLKKYFSPIVNDDEELCLLQIFKPLYVLLSALGLFPQAVQFPNGIQNTLIACKHTLINSACTLFMIVVIHGFFVFHLQELSVASEDNALTEDRMTLVNYTIDLSLQVLFCTVSFFHVIRDRSLYVTILNDLAACWARLAAGKRRATLGRLRVQVNCAVLGSVLAVSLVMATVALTGTYNLWKILLISMTFVLPELIQFMMLVFYFVMILMVMALLKNIKEQFEIILHVRNNLRDSSVKAGFGVNIAELREVYVRTMRIKRRINAAFQAPILVALAMIFHELVSLPHMVYHGLSFQSSFSTHEILECGCWVFNQLLKIYVLAQSGALLKSQVNKIGRTLHNIPISGDQDVKAYLEVQHFTSLMAVQDSTITIYGYFPLDSTLMFNIIASAAMYFIIFVQFDA